MLTFTVAAIKDSIEQETGIRPSFALEAFPDVEAAVFRRSPHQANISGFVYEAETGKLRPVT